MKCLSIILTIITLFFTTPAIAITTNDILKKYGQQAVQDFIRKNSDGFVTIEYGGKFYSKSGSQSEEYITVKSVDYDFKRLGLSVQQADQMILEYITKRTAREEMGQQYAANIQKCFGEWSVILVNNGADIVATTKNDSGSFIDFRCSAESQQCGHILNCDIACKDGYEYPVLVNSDFTARSTQARCFKNGKIFELYLKGYDRVHEILQKGNYVGFAIPMESGYFKVVRFSLQGSGKAINYVKQHYEKQHVPKTSNHDTYL